MGKYQLLVVFAVALWTTVCLCMTGPYHRTTESVIRATGGVSRVAKDASLEDFVLMGQTAAFQAELGDRRINGPVAQRLLFDCIRDDTGREVMRDMTTIGRMFRSQDPEDQRVMRRAVVCMQRRYLARERGSSEVATVQPPPPPGWERPKPASKPLPIAAITSVTCFGLTMLIGLVGAAMLMRGGEEEDEEELQGA